MADKWRLHERELLDALEVIEARRFAGIVWRITRSGREPTRGAASDGRWSSAGAFEVLYTSLEREGALAEIGHRLLLEPIWPSRIEHEIHELAVRMERTIDLSAMATLQTLGVDIARYNNYDYAATQAISAAARFLGFDALIVPSARYPASNLVILLENLEASSAIDVRSTAVVDWTVWRKR